MPKLRANPDLTRGLVSFQANRGEPEYRWFKFKEGFSAALVHYVFDKVRVFSGRVLDPFAGSGTTLFTASARGLDTLGIELLPVGFEIINARKEALQNRQKVMATLQKWVDLRPWQLSNNLQVCFPHLRITEGAFHPQNQAGIGRYLGALRDVRDKASRSVLRLAILSVLEDVSYTRKDGQYLRWDYRSGRGHGKKNFNKGPIKEFDTAILRKLRQLIDDLNRQPDLFEQSLGIRNRGSIEVICGSCLEELPKLPRNSFDAVMTSPPYCNRYDYTRTYALELAMLGTTERSVRALRQRMLSCTVENREKSDLTDFLDTQVIREARTILDRQDLLQLICRYLTQLREMDLLNNPGIARMVQNYFWEMTLVILVCARLLKPGAPFIMVNDNVRYAGISVPVDLILSKIAESAGFDVEAVWVLPRGKGNSSQQMGAHGREEMRKCVYIWRVPKEK